MPAYGRWDLTLCLNGKNSKTSDSKRRHEKRRKKITLIFIWNIPAGNTHKSLSIFNHNQHTLYEQF